MSSIVRTIVRQRRLSILLVALVFAVVFGGALGALAGARRSSTAMDRLLAYSTPEDVYVDPGSDATLDMQAVDHLRQVLAAAYESYLAMVPLAPDGQPQLDLVGSINPYMYTPVSGPPDAINRLRIVHGRDLDPARPLEAVIDEELAADRGLHVGSHLMMGTYAVAQQDAVFSRETSGAAPPSPAGPTLDLTIVGIARMPVDIHPGEKAHTTSFGGTKELYVSPALYTRYGVLMFDAPGKETPQGIRLVHGSADLHAFSAAVAALPGGDRADIEVGGSDAQDSARTARRAIGVETASLLALAATLAVGGLALVANALARLARSAVGELTVLRAIGLRPVEVLGLAMAPGAAAVGAGTVGAVAVAYGVSPLMPIGLGRQAEVAPGFHLDVPVIAFGFLAVLLLGAATALLTSRPSARAVNIAEASPRATKVGLGERLASIGAPLGPTIGARFAAGRQSKERSAPLRSATVAAAVAIVVLVAVATYNTSLHRLMNDPSAQGEAWDLSMGNINLSDYTAADISRLTHDPHIDGVAAVASPEGRGSIDGREFSLVGFHSIEGGVGPRTLTGRLPSRLGEVALGQRTASSLHVHVGDEVTVSYNGVAKRAHVVGTALLGPGITPTMQIGDGALVTISQFREFVPDQPVTFLLARVTRGTSIDREITALRAHFGRNVARPVVATDVVNLDRANGVPVALALALAAAATVILGVALVLSVRQRRIDIGVLRAIGATREQLRAALIWEALWLYAGAAVIGVPFGLVAGRVLWRQVTGGIGVLMGPARPGLPVALVAAGGLVVVLALVALPARAATRQPPSRMLRTE